MLKLKLAMFSALAAVMMTVVAPATSPASTFGPDYGIKAKAKPTPCQVWKTGCNPGARTFVFDAGTMAKGGSKK